MAKEIFRTRTPGGVPNPHNAFSSKRPHLENVRQGEDNVAALERELNALEHGHRLDGGTPLSIRRFKVGDFFEHAKLIGALFKESRLPRTDRERLWRNFQSLCTEVRSIQEEFRNASSKNSGLLLSRIDAAFHMARGADGREGIQRAAAEKEDILALFKQYDLTQPDRERCWNLFTQLCDAIRSNRNRLQSRDYLEAKKLADDCSNTASYGNPHEALKEIDEARASICDLYMDKGQRESVRDELNRARDTAVAKLEETKREKQKAHREWKERTEGNIERWERNIEKAEDSISRLESHLDDLREKERSAWNDDFADRVRGWISETEQKIDDRRESIRNWQNKIDDAKSRLRG